MSPIRKFLVPLRLVLALAGGLSIMGTGLSAAPARAASPLTSDMMPLRDIKPGMKGYGLTTFKGNTISRFEVTIIGVIKKYNNGRDVILIRMKGGPITERGANLIHGMSGSPIYINEKLIGAFSMGEAFPKEPLGMVTPIEDMLEAWDPNIPQHPDYFQPAEKSPPTPGKTQEKRGAFRWKPDNKAVVENLPQPIQVGERRITQLVLNAPLNDPRQSSNSVAVLHPANSIMSVSGISERNRVWFEQQLQQKGYNITVMNMGGQASGNSPAYKGAPLHPGSAFGTFLSVGDVQFGGTGTVTYRRGDRMLGFGHPLMGLGALEGAITSAYIIDIFPGVQTSHHIAIAGPVVGTLRQDRDFSVSGDIGKQPKLIPMQVTVRDETNHRSQTFYTKMFQHPDLTPQLLSLVAREAIGRVHDIPGDVMARVTTTVDAAEVGKITRTNLYFDANDISSQASEDMSEITNIISGNPFYPLPIRSANMTVDLMPGHNTATVERIFLKQGRYEPGDTMEIGVSLKPYRRDPVVKTISLKIPSDTPTGRYQLMVRGGVSQQIRFGGLILGGGQQDSPQAPPENVRQMIARLNEHETNTDMVARLILNSVAPSLEGEKLSQLPPNLAALMRSDRNSGVRLERDEVKTIQPAGYVTTGVQQLVVTIVRKNAQEPAAGTGVGVQPTGGVPGVPNLNVPGAGGQLANPNDDVTPDSSVSSLDVSERLSANPVLKPWITAIRAGALMTAPPAPKKDDKKDDKAKADTSKAADTSKTAAPPTPPTVPAPAASAPAAPDTANDKPVGRQMQTWKQTARTDFGAGKFTGTSVAANGVLRIAPTLQRLASTSETYIWSLTSDENGVLYAGTGSTGKVLKIEADGKQTVLASLPVVSIQTLLYSPADKSLYAGSGVKGNVYKVGMDGSYKLITKLPEKYILALLLNNKGDLFIGPGGGGTVYRIPFEKLAGITTGGSQADTAAIDHPDTFIKTSADHIMALTEDSKNNLYVGTGNDGIVYKVTPDGQSSVLYDAKENSITALSADKDGNVYAATGPKGILYRISPDGGATTLFDRAAAFYTGLKAMPDGSLYATTVNAVFHFYPSSIDPNQPIVVPLDNPKDVDFLSLAVLPDGSIAAGTGNIGEVYGVGPHWNAAAAAADTRSGQFVSVAHDAKLMSKWGSAHWEATLPTGSSVRLETRTGHVAEPDTTWSAWAPVKASGKSEGIIGSPPARFIQYRVSLTAKGDVQPSLREVSLGYLPKNQAPKVAFQSPVGGEKWAKTQTIRWVGNDPDNDTITYDLYYSNDAGATWKPFPSQPKPATIATGTAPASTVTTTTPPSNGAVPTLEEYQKQLNERNLPEPIKQALLEGYKRRLAAGGASASLKDTSKSWDTTTLPDGVYWLKVVASDHISNATDPQTGQVISESFIVSNAMPKITFSNRPQIGSEKSVLLQGTVSQSLIAVTAVQVRIDGGEWMAAVSKDGLFDSSQEDFTFLTAPLTSGKHTIEVEAFNSAGSKASEKSEVTIP